MLDTPTVLASVPRIVVIGDIHGDLSRLMDIMYGAQIINRNMEWIAEPKNTIVVQLGDQIDSMTRTPTQIPDWERIPDTEVLGLMDQLDTIARHHGGRVLSLLGNHEYMNVLGDFSYVSENSRRLTSMRAQKFAPNGQYSTILAKRAVVLRIGDILFCHGGLLPHHFDMVGGNLHIFNELSRKFLRGLPMTQDEAHILLNGIMGENGITWSRMYIHLLDEPEKLVEVIQNVLGRTGCKSICVGHNTVENILPVMGGALWFLDNGISRAYGKNSYQFLEILETDDGNGIQYRVVKIEAT